VRKVENLEAEAEHAAGEGRRQIRWPARIIPSSIISEVNEHMDDFSNIFDAALSIFVGDTLFLAMTT
jgi:hypothetical protein